MGNVEKYAIEKEIISCLINEPFKINICIENQIETWMFADPLCKKIYEFIIKCFADKIEFTKDMIYIEFLNHSTTLLKEFPLDSFSAKNINYYIEKLKTISYKIRISNYALKLSNEISEKDFKNKNEIFDYITSNMRVLESHKKNDNSLVTNIEVINRFETEYDSPNEFVKYIPTGINSLDKYLTGLRSGRLYLIAARPGVGKTTLGMQFMINAIMSGKKAFYASVEMQSDELLDKMISNIGKIDPEKLERKNLDSNEIDKMSYALRQMRLAKFSFFTNFDRSYERIENAIRIEHQKANLDIAFVDYLQQFQLTFNKIKKLEQRNLELGEITARLKSLAQNLSIPIVALSQINREFEPFGDDYTPKMHHLKESGNLEQDADVIITMAYPKYYNRNLDENELHVDIQKNRKGQPGKLKLYVDYKYSFIGDLN